MSPKPKFNRTNENIDYALWSWNPVTGCNTGCKYCYAKGMADRFNKGNFEPTFHPDRLDAPYNTKLPKGADTDIKKGLVFVCSMADLFGDWVPDEWIDLVLSNIHDNPRWKYLFLTKNPERYYNFSTGGFLRYDSWVGATIDTQARVQKTEAVFSRRIADVQFVSCEPLLEPVVFTDMSNIDWLIIGARSRTSKCPEFQPPLEWVESLLHQARDAGVSVYIKPNLKVPGLTVRPKEYPGVD